MTQSNLCGQRIAAVKQFLIHVTEFGGNTGRHLFEIAMKMAIQPMGQNLVTRPAAVDCHAAGRNNRRGQRFQHVIGIDIDKLQRLRIGWCQI